MNGKLVSLLLGAAFGCSVCSLEAAPLNFGVTTTKKRLEVERTGTASTTYTKEKWGYTITLENKSFQNLSDIEVQYRQYKFADKLKGDGALKPVPGSNKMNTLANGAKFSFDTDPVEVDKQELKAGWSYHDGSKEKVKDALAGYWLRLLKDGAVVFEYQYPPELAKKAKWE